MKRKNLIVFSLLLTIVTWSCSSKTESATDSDETASEEWKGMDDFHMIMAESFHPYRDSANVAPAKQYAREMVTLANQ
ncbi:MAG: hypothetical protein RIF34_05400 [Candidatus Kapaibacterium sp.]